MSTMQCDVVSVKESLYSGTVTMLIAKGAGGELGIMPGHAPLVTEALLANQKSDLDAAAALAALAETAAQLETIRKIKNRAQ